MKVCEKVQDDHFYERDLFMHAITCYAVTDLHCLGNCESNIMIIPTGHTRSVPNVPSLCPILLVLALPFLPFLTISGSQFAE